MPVKIHGKDYITVNERVHAFREEYPGWTIDSSITHTTNDSVIVKTSIIDDTGRVISTGMANERQSNGHINKTSHVENAETSAVGRALGFLGYGIETSIASAEEVHNAVQATELTVDQKTVLNEVKNEFQQLSSTSECYDHWEYYKKDNAFSELLPEIKKIYGQRYSELREAK